MTEWNRVTTVQHIPDEELHAYLDQALSRSQAADIELHLARCPRCQAARDDIARLRDRTTALLAELGPTVTLAPPLAALRARAAARTASSRRVRLAAAWAASLAGAVLLGWMLRAPGSPGPIMATPENRDAPATLAGSGDAPAAAPIPLQPARAPAPETVTPARRLIRVATPTNPAEPPLRFAALAEASAADLMPRDPEVGVSRASGTAGDLPDLIAQPVEDNMGLQGLWRTIIPDSSGLLRAVDVPLVPGLPVVQMRVQPGANGPDVTAVDQMLESGELVRTLAGPAARVSALVASDETEARATGVAAGTSGRVTVTIQQGDRMVAVTGPSLALGSLLHRVNARRRY